MYEYTIMRVVDIIIYDVWYYWYYTCMYPMCPLCFLVLIAEIIDSLVSPVDRGLNFFYYPSNSFLDFLVMCWLNCPLYLHFKNAVRFN